MPEESHPVYEASGPGTDPDIYHEDDGDVLAEIDFDEEAEIPIFAYVKESGSRVVFCIPDEGPDHLRILFVGAQDPGDMSDMIDFLVGRFGLDHLIFFNIVNDELLSSLDNPSTRTKQIDGNKVLIAETTWEVDS